MVSPQKIMIKTPRPFFIIFSRTTRICNEKLVNIFLKTIESEIHTLPRFDYGKLKVSNLNIPNRNKYVQKTILALLSPCFRFESEAPQQVHLDPISF